jgi:hypothetical protein
LRLFNRFAQSAGLGLCRPSDDRRNPNEQENKQENKQTNKQRNKPTNKQTNTQTAKRQHDNTRQTKKETKKKTRNERPQNHRKMVPEAENRDQIWAEMVQKRSKNKPKRAKINTGARESGPWRIYVDSNPKIVQKWSKMEAKIEPTSQKKRFENRVFFIGLWIGRWREKGYQNQPKWRPIRSKIDPSRERKEKTRKV